MLSFIITVTSPGAFWFFLMCEFKMPSEVICVQPKEFLVFLIRWVCQEEILFCLSRNVCVSPSFLKAVFLDIEFLVNRFGGNFLGGRRYFEYVILLPSSLRCFCQENQLLIFLEFPYISDKSFIFCCFQDFVFNFEHFYCDV